VCLLATFLLLAAAYVSPLADWGEHRSFAAHMAQHLLIGDLAALMLVLSGIGRLPRVVLVLALPIWVADLAFWHVPVIYEAALHRVAVHEAQHAALWVSGILLWSAILSRVLPIGARLALLVGMMVSGLAISSLFLWWPRVLYSTYAHAQPLAGMSALTDQRVGGGLMLLEGMSVGLLVAAWLIVQLLREDVPAAREGASPSL
jgi:cytochrome c oxidase assembly factor CtaG